MPFPFFGMAPMSKTRGKKRARVARKPALKRTKRKVAVPLGKKVKTLSKKVSALSKKIESLNGELTYRDINYQVGTAGVNATAYLSVSFNSVAQIKTTVAQLRYYDIKIPGALLVVNLDDAPFNINVDFTASSVSATIRANYQVPVKYIAYFMSVKSDTSLSPVQIMTDQDADFSNANFLSPGLFPEDFEALTDLYRIKKLGMGIIDAGQEKTFSHRASGSFEWDPSFNDMHSDSYQPRYKSGFLVIRFQGVLAHDDVDGNLQGMTTTVIDIVNKKNQTIKYDAGGDIKYIHVQDDGSTFTGNAVFTNKPVADNQTESKA